ncbi:MAG: interleukin-like EMT inducer domain-containing protein [Thermoanaerobaculia bacterium]
MIKARVLAPFVFVLLLLLGATFPDGTLPLRVQLVVAMAALGALASIGARIAGLLLPETGSLTRAVIAFEVAVAAVVIPATWLGHFGQLSARALLVWIVAAFLLTRLLARPVPAAAADAAGFGRDGANPSRLEKAERLALALAACVFLALMAATMIRYRYAAPGEIQYDDSCYHLPAVSVWRHFGDLRMLKFPIGDTAMTFFPVAGELFTFFLVSILSPFDFLARWCELPFAIFCLVGVAALAVQLGLNRRSALLASLLFGLTNRYFVDAPLMLTAGTDLATGCHVLATALGALLLAEKPRLRRAIVAGLPLGLLLGTKYTGVLFAAPLAMLLLSCLAAGAWRRKPVPWGRTLALLTLLSAVALAVGGYTYLRNAVTAGNPLFPVPVTLFGHALLPGWAIVGRAVWKLDPVNALQPWGFLWKRVDLFGSLFRVTLLPAALLAPLVAMVLALRRRERFTTAILLMLPAAFYLEFVLLMNDHRENRYFVAAPALAAIALLWLLGRAGERTQGALRLAGAAAVIACVLVTRPADVLTCGWMWLAAAALASAAATLAAGLLGPGPVPAARVALAAIAAGVLIGPLPTTIERFTTTRFDAKPVAGELDRRTRDGGAVIAYAGWNQPYPYVGSRQQNRVEFVSNAAEGPSPYYAWKGDARTERSPGTLVAWLANLRSARVDYVVAEGPPSGSLEATWVALARDAIAPLSFDGWAVLAHVREVPKNLSPRLTLLAGSSSAGAFLDKGTGLSGDETAGTAAFVIPASGGGFVIPPTGHAFQWLQLQLASGTTPAEPVGARVNGQDASRVPLTSTVSTLCFAIPEGSWSAEGNTIQVIPAPVTKRAAATARIGTSAIEIETPLSAESCGFWAGSRAVLRVGMEEVIRTGSGYHLALLSPARDRSVEIRSFDTYASREASEALSMFIEGLAPGAVVVGAVAEDASVSLSPRAVAALRSLGCAVDLRARYRHGHAFIGVKGAPAGSVPEWSAASPALVSAGPELLRVSALELLSSPPILAGSARVDHGGVERDPEHDADQERRVP